MKKSIFYLIFILTLNGISYAQLPLTYGVRKTMDLYETNKLATGNSPKLLTENNIEGSPYYNDEFLSGTIFTVQKLKYIEVQLRYNIYNDNLEFKTPANEIQALAKPEIVEKVVIGDVQLIFSQYLKGNKVKNGFFILFDEGKASLYIKPVVIFKDASEPAAYKLAEPARFVKKEDEYYIRFGDEPAKLITGKKDLITLFPDNQEIIENFMSKNKIKTNKPEELREVIRFYNSL
jgi:hypothetical protein